MRIPQLRQRLRDLGAAPCHEGRVLRSWVQGRSLDNARQRAEDFLPLIVAQVVLARSRRTVKKVVFMGMGEPAHNLDNVLEAIELLGLEGGMATRTWSFPPSATGACSSACRSPR